MEISNKKWVFAALLSILIPISLLATSRFTGILQEPLTPEVTEAEIVNWSMTRPAGYRLIGEKVICRFMRNDADIELDATINEYEENSPSLPFEGNDGLIIRVTATANIRSGFIHSANIKFLDYDDESLVDVSGDPYLWKLQNAEIDRIEDWQPEAYVGILAVGTPQYCMVEISSFWVFFDRNNVNHQMTIALQLTYSDGVGYQRAVLPIHLEVSVI